MEHDGGETDPALVARVAEILRARPAGLVSDIDGTISAISASPGTAVVHAGARAGLAALAERLDLVAVVSGRAVDDARAMVGLPGVVYIGNHGMERQRGDSITLAEGVQPFLEPLACVLQELNSAIDIPGVRIENKRVSGSIHYRQTADPQRARAEILRALRPLAERAGLRLSEGRLVIELRPPLPVNKGTAVADLARDAGLRGMVFLGDDVTDLDAMRALASLDRQGVLRGLSVAVASPETPPAVMEAAGASVDGVEGVVALLNALARRLADGYSWSSG